MRTTRRVLGTGMGPASRVAQLTFAAAIAFSSLAASAANCDASTFAEFVTCAAGAATPGDTITLQADVLPDGTAVVPTVDVSVVNNGFQLIGAAGPLLKQGSGSLVLPAANSYSGATIIQAGAVVVGASSSLGAGAISLEGGALVGAANVTVGAGNIQLNGASTIAAATGTTLTVVNLNVGFGATATLGVASATGTIDIGAIGTVDSSADFVLSDGTVRATDGTLGVALAAAASTTLGAGVTLDGNAQLVSIANIAGSGQIVNTAPGALQLRAGTYGGVISGDGNVDKSTPSAVILTGNNTYTGPTLITGGTLHVGNGGTSGTLGSGGVNVGNGVLMFNRSDAYAPPQPINGTGAVWVVAGTVTFSGTNGYTGTTMVAAGTLLVNGTNASALTVVTGTLGGTGQVGNVQSNAAGTISPGLSPGILNTGSLEFSSPATATFEISGPTVGTQYDQINVTGGVTLGANLNVTGAYVPVLGDTFVLIDNDGADAIAGTFAGIPEGTTSLVNGTLMRISYVGGDGNDVTLSVVSHTVTPGAAGPNGTINPDTPQTVANGGTTSFTITPNANYLASVGGDCGPPAGPSLSPILYTTNAVTADCMVTPTFALDPNPVPAKPGAPLAQAGTNTATITLADPPNDGIPITGYTVTSDPPGGVDSSAGSLNLSRVITGLTNGVAYTFTVVASNANGDSLASDPSNQVRPALPTATITVDSLLDDGVACTLRKAIENSNGVDAPHPACVTGGLENTIVFSVSGTIALVVDTLFVTDRSLTIIGNGAANTIIDGQMNVRPFEVCGCLPITLALRNLTITNGVPGSGPPAGGGLFVDFGATARLEDVVFSGNNGGFAGGAILNFGTLEVERSTFSGNFTFPGGGTFGGAIANASLATLLNSTFVGNSSDYGGAIAQVGDTADGVGMSIINSTFSGNTGNEGGGAIASFDGDAPIGLAHVTVSGNSAGVEGGGGLLNTIGQFSVASSIVAGNTSAGATPPDCASVPTGFVSGNNNVFGTAGCNVAGTIANDFTGPAVLGALASNGGATQTMKPAAGSPALDRAACVFVFDQRGIVRPQGAACDSGALEIVLPGAPTTVVATGGNAQATVTFAAPASAGDGTITGYTVTSGPAGGVDSNAGSTATSHVVTGLTNGTAYTFTVRAASEYGQGPASAASNSVTPMAPTTVPGAPIIGSATAGNGQATVTFTPPASDGGSPITSYTVTSSPGGVTASGAGSPMTVTGLTNGTAYTFTVTATNGAGTGPASAASNSVTPADPDPSRLANISTRGQVLTGNDVMIGGFVIGGSASKTVAIVVTGPSLGAFGITNPLADPTLRLVRSSDQAVVGINDNWQSAANHADLTAAGFAPPNALESALLVDLAPGAYTAIVEGAGGGTGVAVVGVYEVGGPTIPLINISTRGRVGTGNDVMIGGFVIQGSGPRTVAIVATGPSLANFGITNPLANPTIRVVRSSDGAVIAANDDWQTDANATQLQNAGFAPSNPVESGIHTTLPPGAYTVIVEGVGGGTGVAVIGVYAAP